MIGKRSVLTAFVLCYCTIAPNISQAVSLSDLFQTPGATVTADDKIFSDWTLIDLQVVNGGQADLDQIDVSPLVDDPLNPGLKFNAPVGALGTPFGHQGPSSVRLVFSFNAQTANNLPLIKDNSLLINNFIFDAGPGAFIQIAEELNDAAGVPLGAKLAIARSGEAPGEPQHFSRADFLPQAFVHVVKAIDIEGPETNDGAFLRMFEQRFSQVPEPSSLTMAAVLLVCGLAGAVWRRARCL